VGRYVGRAMVFLVAAIGKRGPGHQATLAQHQERQ